MTSNGKVLSAESQRISFGKTKFASDYPDFLEIQLKSFQEFFSIGNHSRKSYERGALQGVSGELPYHGCPEYLRA